MENFFEIKFRLWKEHGLDPVWVESIPFYEYQLWLDMLNDAIDKENTERQTEDGVKQLFSLTK